MKNRELFHKDPLSWNLANEGVSSNNATDLPTLRWIAARIPMMYLQQEKQIKVF